MRRKEINKKRERERETKAQNSACVACFIWNIEAGSNSVRHVMNEWVFVSRNQHLLQFCLKKFLSLEADGNSL